MSKEISFYNKDIIDFNTKFDRYMDSLVSHTSTSRIESAILIIIYYTELISGFFSEQVGLIDENDISLIRRSANCDSNKRSLQKFFLNL